MSVILQNYYRSRVFWSGFGEGSAVLSPFSSLGFNVQTFWCWALKLRNDLRIIGLQRHLKTSHFFLIQCKLGRRLETESRKLYGLLNSGCMSRWYKLLQPCRYFSSSYAVILVVDPSVELFLAAWKGSCMRDFFALAVTMPGGALDVSDGELWEHACLGCSGSTMLWLLLWCSVIWTFRLVPWLWEVKWEEGTKTVKGPGILWRTAVTFAAEEISIYFDELCCTRSICVFVLLLSSEMPIVWVRVQQSCSLPNSSIEQRFIWTSGERKINVILQMLFSHC